MLNADMIKRRGIFRTLTRQFFDQRHFVEVDTPHMMTWPGMEPHLDPYAVELQGQNIGYLNTSPELELKKLFGASGLENIYELAHSYRGGERGPWHTREFVMLEWYSLNQTLDGLMDTCSQWLSEIFPEKAQHRITVDSWMKLQLGMGMSDGEMAAVLEERGVSEVEDMDPSERFFRLFLPTESALKNMGIVFLYHYPKEQCSYSRVLNGRAQRVEVYIDGVEVGNGYLEKANAHELQSQLLKEQKQRRDLGRPVFEIDETFVRALDHIESPISGMAMGWDRLFSLWVGSEDLTSTSPFPRGEESV